MRVGFLGTGIMGGAIARRILAAGHDLVVYDPRPEATAQLVESGAERAGSPAEVARASEVVFASLPSPAAAEAAALASDGAFNAGDGGARTYIDLTTNRPSLARRLASEAVRRGITMLDAPVSGGKIAARRGELAILIGGDAETLDRYRPLLETFGSKLFHVGPAGQGNVAKLVNNVILLANLTVAFEGLVLGVKAGLDADRLFEIVRASSGNSLAWSAAVALLQDRDFSAKVARLEIGYKDIHLAGELARELNLPLPICTQAERMWLQGMALGWADDDVTSLIRLFEEPAGVTVRISERPQWRPG